MRIEHLRPGRPLTGQKVNNCRLVRTVRWIAHTASSWRDLPWEFGNWHSVHARLSRWETCSVWYRMAETLQDQADLKQLFIDSIIVNAPACCRSTKNADDWSLQGGLKTTVDSLGNPLRKILSGRED